jgi:endonuclease IV
MLATQLQEVVPYVKYGFHVPKEKTVCDTFRKYESSELQSFQIYVASPKQFTSPNVSAQDVYQASSVLARCDKFGCIHGSLLYNIAGGAKEYKPQQHSKTITNLAIECDIAAGFSMLNPYSGVVVHSGSCTDRKKGTEIAGKTLDAVLTTPSSFTKQYAAVFSVPESEYISKRRVMLENSAGEGTKLGNTLDSLAEILEAVSPENRDRVDICIDTMHIFGAGQYNFGDSDQVVKFFDDFDKKIGLKKLKCIHLNDCDPSVSFGGKNDRHACLCQGNIWGNEDLDEKIAVKMASLGVLLHKATELGIPLIGETTDSLWDYTIVQGLCGKVEENMCNC